MVHRTAESNKAAAIRLYLETFQIHNLDVAEELLSPDLVFHNAGREIRGHDGWRAFVEGWLTGFPDLRVTVDFSIADEDRVLLH